LKDQTQVTNHSEANLGNSVAHLRKRLCIVLRPSAVTKKQSQRTHLTYQHVASHIDGLFAWAALGLQSHSMVTVITEMSGKIHIELVFRIDRQTALHARTWVV